MAYKKQHWLAKSYLKGFAVDPKVRSRDAKIWKFDDTKSRLARVEKECMKFHFYSKARAKKVEMDFQELEDHFIKYRDKALKRGKLTRKEYYSLILQIFIIHFRTASYDNQTGLERYDVFNRATSEFLRAEIVGLEDRHATPREVYRAMLRDWRLELIAAKGAKFFTSDHPSIIFDIVFKGTSFAFLPVTPDYGLLAFHRRKVRVARRRANIHDVRKLNWLQAFVCTGAVYSSEEFSHDDLFRLSLAFKHPKRSEFGGKMDEIGLTPESIGHGANEHNQFHFIEVLSDQLPAEVRAI